MQENNFEEKQQLQNNNKENNNKENLKNDQASSNIKTSFEFSDRTFIIKEINLVKQKGEEEEKKVDFLLEYSKFLHSKKKFDNKILLWQCENSSLLKANIADFNFSVIKKVKI